MSESTPHLRDSFLRRVLIVIGITTTVVLSATLLWFGIETFFLIFAGVLLAVFLSSLAEWVSERSSLSYGWSLTGVVGALLLVVGVGGWLLAPQVSAQIDQLIQQLPQAVRQVEQGIKQYAWGQWLAQTSVTADTLTDKQLGDALAQATGFVSTVIGALTSFVIIVVIGLYLAAQPRLYIRGCVQLVPHRKRDRTRAVLRALGDTLQWWLVGRFISMSLVGILTALGLWLLGVPLALTLGLIAALLEFVPYIGTILSAVPAILLALLQGPMQALWVVLLYFVIQSIESYLLTPLVQQRVVSLPPALVLAAQVLMGVLFGVWGIILATPLTAALLVLVQMLYIEDILGDPVKV
jgi:predicted PurR-regulated permease PerM